MSDNVLEQYGLPINIEGEVVARIGTGSRDVAGSLPQNFSPVNAEGELVVNLAPADAEASFVTAKTDPVTGRIKVSDALGGSLLGLLPTSPVYIIGDSIHARYNDAAAGVNLSYVRGDSYIAVAENLLLGRLVIGGNLAVSGSRLAAISAQADAAIAAGASVVIENGGINDITGDNATVSAVVAAKLIMWEKLRAAGIKVISAAITPANQALANMTVAKSQKIAAANAALALAAPSYGVRFADVYAAMVDVENANGDAVTNYLQDNLHPSILGAQAAGAVLASAISASGILPDYPLISSPIQNWASGGVNNAIVSNGLFTGTGGTFGTGITTSGGVPASWDIQRGNGSPTASIAIVASPDGVGSAIEATITATAASDSIVIRTIDMSSHVSINDIATFEMMVKAASATNLQSVYLDVVCAIDGVNQHIYRGLTTNLLGGMGASMSNQLLRTAKTKLQTIAGTGAAVTAMRAVLIVVFSAAGSAVITVSRARGQKF